MKENRFTIILSLSIRLKKEKQKQNRKKLEKYCTNPEVHHVQWDGFSLVRGHCDHRSASSIFSLRVCITPHFSVMRDIHYWQFVRSTAVPFPLSLINTAPWTVQRHKAGWESLERKAWLSKDLGSDGTNCMLGSTLWSAHTSPILRGQVLSRPSRIWINKLGKQKTQAQPITYPGQSL